MKRLLLGAWLFAIPVAAPAQERPFGTLREQAAMQQQWLKKRLETFLPPLMRKHGIDLWVMPMREYNEDPVFSSITAPETFAARRRTIYVFFDKCAAAGTAASAACVERIALGGTSQGAKLGLRHPVDARPEVDRAQLLAAVGFEIEKQLRTIRGVAAHDEADDERSARHLAAEHVHWHAEIFVGPAAEDARVLVGLQLDGGDRLVERHRLRPR